MVDKGQKGDQGEPGDSSGSPNVDPTKNVLDLVKAESKYQDAMRDSLKEKLGESHQALKDQIKDLVNFLTIFQNSQRDSETRRIDQLAQTRQEFQNTIRDMLAESVRTTSTLVSTQLVQIQATFDTRVSKLEAGAFIQAGKEQRPDPALADAMGKMTASWNSIQDSNAQVMAKVAASISALQTTGEKTESRGMGQGQVIGWIVGAAMLITAILGSLVMPFILRGN